MYKIAMMFRFLPDVDKEKARPYLTGPHADLFSRIPGLLRYSQSHHVEALGVLEEVETEVFDAYVYHWYENREALETAMKSPEWAATGEDAASFVDGTSAIGAAVDERILEDGALSPFKVVWYVHFKKDISKQEASDYWTDIHGPMTLDAAGFTRYVQNVTINSLGDDPTGRCYDGFSEHWFESRQAYEAALASPAWDALAADGVNFVDRSWIVGAIVEEHFVSGGQPEAPAA